jgi:hypothetical protein
VGTETKAVGSQKAFEAELEDTRLRGNMHPNDYIGRSGLLRLHEECRAMAGEEGGERTAQLLNLMRNRADGQEKHDIPHVVAAALACKADGMDQLLSVLPELGTIYTLAVIDTLWLISGGFPVPRGSLDLNYEPYRVDDYTKNMAREKLTDLIVDAENRPEVFQTITLMLQVRDTVSLPNSPPPGAFMQFYLGAIRDASIVLTGRALREFSTLINESSREQTYQIFLESNPVCIDPLAAEVTDQSKLGSEFTTDFLIRRHDYRYIYR